MVGRGGAQSASQPAASVAVARLGEGIAADGEQGVRRWRRGIERRLPGRGDDGDV